MRVITCLQSFMFALIVMLCAVAPSFAQVSVTVTIAPPDLPVYEQPVCPGDGYIWTPGYWAWDGEEYYWVPGTWVEAPEVGYLWTPPYWAWNGGAFVFYEGYWAPEVGFYGGVDYGFGYFGHGYEGGRWDHGHFFYNRAASNVDVTIVHNVYNTTVVNQRAETRVSYNGGNGGINARPTAQEQAAAGARHIPPVAAQTRHVQAARSNQEFRASVNHGKPPVAATPQPGIFKGKGIAAAKEGGAVHNAASGNNGARNAPAAPGRAAVHPNELPPAEHPAPVNTGNAKADQKYQQQQEKLEAKQEKQRQALQAKQDKEHQQSQKQNRSDVQKQEMEQRHQQQTQQLVQKQNQEQQKLREKQPPQRTASKDENKGKEEKR